MKYQWVWRGLAPEDEVAALAQASQLPRGIAAVLVARGIRTPEEVRRFLEPSREQLPCPFRFAEMAAAVELLHRARQREEVVWVHGDYDVDGIASTATLVDFLQRWGIPVGYSVPSRVHESYGLTEATVEQARQAGASVLIAVDCGTNAEEAIAAAAASGIDVIVCDHHELTGERPPAVALLNPRVPGSGYPFPLLAACGVAFKFVWALAQRWGEPEQAFEYLDFVMLATVADLVPMVEENRVLTALGLERLRRAPRPGILGLLQCVGLAPEQVTTADVIFTLAPRLNAAGRLGDARRAVELLLQDDTGVAYRIAQELECENFRRRVVAEQVYAEALEHAEEMLRQRGRHSMVLCNPSWHPGVLGVVATRLAERYQVPVILLSQVGGFLKGSARSGGSMDLLALLSACAPYLYDYGGHPCAAGVVLQEEQLEAFREAVERIASASEIRPMEKPELRVDAMLKFSEITPRFLLLLRRLAPFGYGNFRPVFLAHGVRIVGCRTEKLCRVEQCGVQFPARLDGLEFVEVPYQRQRVSILYTLEEDGGTDQAPGMPVVRIHDVSPDGEQPWLK